MTMSISAQRVATVKKNVEDPNFDYEDEQLRRDIYDSIRYDIASKMRDDACPPLGVLVYAIRNILEPTFIVSQILDLINLLAHVNIIRNCAVEKARNVLKWNKYYKSTPSAEVLMLSQKDTQLLESLLAKQEDASMIFSKMINACFRLDIYHLQRAGDVNKTKQRLTLYFPDHFPRFKSNHQSHDVKLVQYLHRHGLSPEVTRATATRCARLMSDSTRFSQDPERYCAELGVPFGSFSDIFLPPDESVISETLRWYLRRVVNIVETLENLFPGQET